MYFISLLENLIAFYLNSLLFFKPVLQSFIAGLFDRYGKPWQEQRRFNIRCLRDFGMGKQNLEEFAQNEARYLVEIFRSHKGALFDPAGALTTAVANIMCKLVFGQRFEHGDREFEKIFQLFNESIRLAEFAGAVNFLPFLRHFPNLTKVDKLVENRRKEVEFIRKMVDAHKATLDRDNPRDFVDAFLLEIERTKELGVSDTTFTGRQTKYFLF